MTARMGAWAAVAAAVVSGCISGAANTLGGTKHITWLDDGVMIAATAGQATWSSTAGRDSVEILGLTSSVSLTIYAASPTPFATQTFACGQTTAEQALLFAYKTEVPDAGTLFTSQSCTLTFTQIGAVGGAPVIGTFEVALNVPGGGTKNIANGSFNVPLSM